MKKSSDEAFIKAVAESTCMAEVLRTLGLKTFNYKSLYARIQRLNLNTSHWNPNKNTFKPGHQAFNKKSVDEMLIEYNPNARNHVIRQRLIADGRWTYICTDCGISEWRGKPITLQVDHINGVNTDYRFENLRLLCPNCHSQTPTFCRGS